MLAVSKQSRHSSAGLPLREQACTPIADDQDSSLRGSEYFFNRPRSW